MSIEVEQIFSDEYQNEKLREVERSGADCESVYQA